METTAQTGGTETTPVQGVDSDILGMLGHTHQKTEHLEQQTNKHDQLLSKLEQVFNPAQPKPDGWYDDVLKTALDAEKAGQPIPLTVKISTELLQAQKQNHELMRKLEALEQKNQIKENPAYQADQAAFIQIDQFMGQGLRSAFGENIPKAVAIAVTQDLAEKIREEQQVNPQRWQEIRSNPQMMKRIVQNAIAQTIPPEARRIQYQNQVENAVYSPDEIKENIREANELLQTEEVRNNPHAAQKIHQSIQRMREMYWEAALPGQNRKARV